MLVTGSWYEAPAVADSMFVRSRKIPKNDVLEAIRLRSDG
jgi:hypothetical protein